MLTEKEKLEEELELLEESLKLDVITKEEFEQTRQRIEERLKSLEQKETAERPEDQEPIKEEKPIEEKEEDARTDTRTKSGIHSVDSGTNSMGKEPAKEEVKIKEIKEEEVKEVPKVEEETEVKPSEEKEDISEKEPEKEEEKVKSAEEIAAEQVKKAAEEKEAKEESIEKKEEVEEAPKEDQAETAKPEEEVDFQISKGGIKVLIYVIAILLLAFGSYFFFFSGGQEDNKLPESSVFIACSSDEDCTREGSTGTCNNPGTEDAECAYVEDVKVKLMVLNGNNCFNCDTGRVLSILDNFFPNLEIENLDIGTNEGKEIADEFDIDALPAYILNSSLQQANNYRKFFNAFNKVGDGFVMKNTASNANYYIEREEIPEKLDLIFKTNQAASLDAEKNLQEFLDAFDGNVDFEKHSEGSVLAKELGINTFPVFLVNNKVKFSGVQAADVIKDNFCRMNDLDECGLELSKSLV